MKKGNNDKCLVIEKRSFLFFHWTDKDYKHKWFYRKNSDMDKSIRICEECGRKEVYWGLSNLNGLITEDWRRTK